MGVVYNSVAFFIAELSQYKEVQKAAYKYGEKQNKGKFISIWIHSKEDYYHPSIKKYRKENGVPLVVEKKCSICFYKKRLYWKLIQTQNCL